MSNSKLISCTLISPNKNSPRNHKIDTITIHCVVGQCSAERIGEIFKPTSRQASSNYGIGYDGRIGLYVDEADRSWCSSSAANDNRAITIEVASDTKHPYAVNDKAYAALLDLVEDICRRNGIKKLVWSTSKDDRVNHKNGCNMTVHRDYANKSCPGDYLYNRHGEIAAEVNRRLGVPVVEQKPEQKPQGDAKNLYRVQLGAFEKKDNATAFAAKLKKEGSIPISCRSESITRCKWARSASRRTPKPAGEVEEGGTRRRFHYLFRHVRRDIGAEDHNGKQSARESGHENLFRRKPCFLRLFPRSHRQRAFRKARRDYLRRNGCRGGERR